MYLHDFERKHLKVEGIENISLVKQNNTPVYFSQITMQLNKIVTSKRKSFRSDCLHPKYRRDADTDLLRYMCTSVKLDKTLVD